MLVKLTVTKWVGYGWREVTVTVEGDKEVIEAIKHAIEADETLKIE